jgi:uncharacterized integral membrane protein
LFVASLSSPERRNLQLESENQEAMTTKSKLILGGILILFGIIFAMQNSTVVQVRFLIWSVQMSQALVIFLTGAVGTITGVLSAPRSRYRGNLEAHSTHCAFAVIVVSNRLSGAVVLPPRPANVLPVLDSPGLC